MCIVCYVSHCYRIWTEWVQTIDYGIVNVINFRQMEMYVITTWHSIVKENITYSKDTSYKGDTTYYFFAHFFSNGLYFVHNDLIVLFFCKKGN